MSMKLYCTWCDAYYIDLRQLFNTWQHSSPSWMCAYKWEILSPHFVCTYQQQLQRVQCLFAVVRALLRQASEDVHVAVQRVHHKVAEETAYFLEKKNAQHKEAIFDGNARDSGDKIHKLGTHCTPKTVKPKVHVSTLISQTWSKCIQHTNMSTMILYQQQSLTSRRHQSPFLPKQYRSRTRVCLSVCWTISQMDSQLNFKAPRVTPFKKTLDILNIITKHGKLW